MGSRAVASSSSSASLGLQRNSEEALRQAYAERLQCLGRKLAAADASEDTLRESHISLDATAMGTSSLQTQYEVEALVQKVRQLCQERRSLKGQAASMDERYAAVILELKGELEVAQLQYSEMRREQSRLRKELSGVSKESQRDRENFSKLKEDVERNMQAEIHRLEAACRLSASRLVAMQNESQDYRRRLQQLGSEQSVIEAEAFSVAGAASAAKLELEGLHERVRQSEAETQQLEEKCALVGERFERVMEVSEKENREQAQELKAKARGFRKKAQKHRKCAEEAKAKLDVALATEARQKTVLAERDTTVQRLREACESERDASLKRQEQFFENQRKALQEQAAEMQRRGGMMPLATHQKMLQEQGEWFANAVRELEEALRRQQHSQERERERALELKEQERQLHEKEKEQEKQRIREMKEKERFLEQREREEFLEVEAVQSEASLRCHKLEEELQDAQNALVQTEASAAAIEEQRSALATSLEAVSGRLGQLRASLETERAAKLRSQAALAEARRRIDATQRTAANSAMQLGAQDELRASWRRLEASWSEQQTKIATCDQATSELRRKDGALQSEVATLHLEKQQMETALRTKQGLGKQLEKQCATTAVATRRKREEVARLRGLLSGHADRSRRAAAELKAKLREEQAALMGDLNGRMQQWKWAVSRDQAQMLAKQTTGKESAEAAKRSNERLAASIDAVRVADERMQIRIDSSVANALAQRNSLERCQANIRIAAADAEQLVLCVGNVLPDGLAPGTVQGLLSGCGGSAVAMASPEALAALEAELRRGLETVKAQAAETARQRWEDKLTRVRAESDIGETAKLLELTEQRKALEPEVHALELELRTMRDRSSDSVERARLVEARKEQLAKLEEQLAHAKDDSRVAAEKERLAQTKLEESKVSASLAEEDARRDARAPLQREIHEVSTQLKTLRMRLSSDFGQQEAAWREHLQKCERSCEAMWQKTEAGLQAEVTKLRGDLSKATKGAEEPCDDPSAEVQEELSASLLQVQDATSELEVLRSQLAALTASTTAHRESIRVVERRTSEASDARRREALEATEAERAAARRHAEAMARLRQQCDTDAASIEAEARSSLGSLSRRIVIGDGGTALQTHAELTAKAERLAERARARLGTP